MKIIYYFIPMLILLLTACGKDMSGTKQSSWISASAEMMKKELLATYGKEQANRIQTGIQLMMEMEICIRKKLTEEFGNKANYGRNSLIAVVQDKLKDSSINWQNIFNDPAYGLYEENNSFEEFSDKVEMEKTKERR